MRPNRELKVGLTGEHGVGAAGLFDSHGRSRRSTGLRVLRAATAFGLRVGDPWLHLRRHLTGPDAQLDFPVLKELAAEGGSDYFAEIDMLIVPSWQEPFGIITLESMSAGIPVIGTGLADVLRGTLVPPHDPHALAGAIRACKPDMTARDYVERNFYIRQVIPRIEEFYSATKGT